MGIAYRPEIDGLRAIAVLAVVLYHAGFGGAGFVGVDVFFVISGYLITSLLLSEYRRTQAIDWMAFYARRVRRIFPAAAVVVLVALAASALLLSPAQQSHTSLSAGSALVFGANLFFQFTSGGYFDGNAEEMPLLHLWSLSVEEQFYFLWPALLIVVLRYRWLLRAIVGLGLASFLLTEWLIAQGTDAAFYQMPARFWELAAGGLIAALPARAMPRYAVPGGILLTLASCAAPFGHFPGVGALPAVAGACLVIAAVHGGATNTFLRSRPMVGVGLISYSLYLWHWPLLAFYRASDGNGPQVRLILCGVAVLLAIASHRYVERPFRKMRWPKGRTVVIGGALSASLALAACTYGLQTRGDPPDMPPRICHSMATEGASLKCPPVEQTRIVIWGDSMAYAWSPLAWDADPKASAFTRDACPPFVGFLPDDTKASAKCQDYNAIAVERAKSRDTVILVARWAVHFTKPGSEQGLRDTLASLSGVRRVVILGPTPEVGMAAGIPRAAFYIAPLTTLQTIAADYPNVEVRDMADHFCTTTECPLVKEGVALYWDQYHVSSTAVRMFKL